MAHRPFRLLCCLLVAAPIALAAQAVHPAAHSARAMLPAAHSARAMLPAPWSALLLPRTRRPTPTTAAITAADLRTRLYAFSDDSMMGREAGSLGNFKGVEYIAAQVKRFGLLPAGIDGTFFQPFVERFTVRTFDSTRTIAVDSTPIGMWTDYLPRDPGGDLRPVDGVQVIWGGNWGDPSSVISDSAAAGKFVVITSSETAPGNPPNIPNRPAVSSHFPSAAGIAVAELDGVSPALRRQFRRPSEFQPGGNLQIYLYITRAAAERMVGHPLAGLPLGTVGRTLHGAFAFTVQQISVPTAYPLRNVVALLPGSDSALRGEYVVLGAHNDHIGTTGSGMSDVTRPMAHDSIYIVDHLFRQGGADDPMPVLVPAQQREVDSILAMVRKATHGRSARIDSIFNGADDDGSGSVSLLEIAQYFAAQRIKPKRSLLFVWHVAEEKGLWGSTYFTDHPTVPRDSIVAELNLDMVGRGGARDQTGHGISGALLHGGTGYVQVVGSRRLSTELGDLAEAVDSEDHHRLHFDYSMDANGHPQQIYCRSDHANYARYGIPVAFFTTGGHADYHQLTDEPQYIDYTRMAQVDNFIADLAKHVADLDHRPVVDHRTAGPQAACVQ